MTERKWRGIRRILRVKRSREGADAPADRQSDPAGVDAASREDASSDDASREDVTRAATAKIGDALQGFQALCEEHGQPISVRQQYRGNRPAGASRTAQVTLFQHRFNRVSRAYALLFRVHAQEGHVKVLQGEAQLQGDLRHPQFLVRPSSTRLKQRLTMDELTEQRVIDLLQAFLEEYQSDPAGSPS